jgi:hypothetical protein
MAGQQRCPICSVDVTPSERYPNYVCETCYARAADEDDRPLTFSNVALSGGFAALYRDTREERSSHICFINGVKCWAEEARLGGIVIQPYVEEI